MDSAKAFRANKPLRVRAPTASPRSQRPQGLRMGTGRLRGGSRRRCQIPSAGFDWLASCLSLSLAGNRPPGPRPRRSSAWRAGPGVARGSSARGRAVRGASVSGSAGRPPPASRALCESGIARARAHARRVRECEESVRE
ncbi:unnamed protein product [Rangifer tarandus platyrhynchus]|uniref:Uncharacterized protein n=1 Tax=Rangifer tarandus platyrhynchus TaxID=3082113 RepID=A0ABN8Z2Q0_RANTA|nr:unnamed protein product [Rangifer tarandus platyrhynchus]